MLLLYILAAHKHRELCFMSSAPSLYTSGSQRTQGPLAHLFSGRPPPVPQLLDCSRISVIFYLPFTLQLLQFEQNLHLVICTVHTRAFEDSCSAKFPHWREDNPTAGHPSPGRQNPRIQWQVDLTRQTGYRERRGKMNKFNVRGRKLLETVSQTNYNTSPKMAESSGCLLASH